MAYLDGKMRKANDPFRLVVVDKATTNLDYICFGKYTKILVERQRAGLDSDRFVDFRQFEWSHSSDQPT